MFFFPRKAINSLHQNVNRKTGSEAWSVSDLSSTMYPGVPPQADMKEPTTDKAM